MNIVKTISTALNSVLQRIIKITRYGNADVQTSQQVSPSGVDSVPVKDTAAAYSATDVVGKTLVLGYLQKNMKAADGEIRIFSTSGEGQATQIWLDNSGNMYFEVEKNDKHNNLVRYNELALAFEQLKTEFNAFVTAYNAHTHISSLPATPTAPPIPTAAPTTADISESRTPKLFTN